MTFQLNFENMAEENNKLQFTYSVDGKLPIEGYRLRDLSFTSGRHTFDVKYSITGSFIVETELDYLQKIEKTANRLNSEIVDPINPLHTRVQRLVSERIGKIERNLASPQLTLDELSD